MNKPKPTGFSTPFGGFSWEYTESEKDIVRKLFNYLEARRLLINPIEMELVNQCAISAKEIKDNLVNLLTSYKFCKETEDIIKNLCDVCNIFLDGLNKVNKPGIIYKRDNDWEDQRFSNVMKEFRFSFRRNISLMEKKYKLKFQKEIPEQY